MEKRKYKKIFLDLESIIKSLYYIPKKDRQEYQLRIKKEIKSLRKLEMMGLISFEFKRQFDLLGFDKISEIDYPCIDFRKQLGCFYLIELLEKYKLEKEDVLVVTADFEFVMSAKASKIDQCYVKSLGMFSVDSDVTLVIDNLRDLKKFVFVEKEKQPAIYINPHVFSYLGSQRYSLDVPHMINKSNLFDKNNHNLILAVTDNSTEAVRLRSYHNCDICFINNHYNDLADCTYDFEMKVEDVPQKLQKLLTSYQND